MTIGDTVHEIKSGQELPGNRERQDPLRESSRGSSMVMGVPLTLGKVERP